ncbi:MAG: Mg-protoporphyrin IX methyl transferase [Methanoregulaceae archaeon PtaU1.Bin222]|nr:MAG: Mg-protoporphyrin IX methyl transferase [Methanoregulaceae archaeon PtaU1.Bin222]
MVLQQRDNAGCWSEYWTALVEEAEEMTGDGQVSFWNRRSGSYSEAIDTDASWGETVERVISLLEEAGFSAPGSRVLDIGCGPGPISLPLARAGAEVTSLDISSGMLQRLREKAIAEGLSIRTLECSWWTADIDSLGFRDNFDLVIASMTPAVKDLGTFKKMMACSKRFCYYSGFLKMCHGHSYPDVCRAVLNEEHSHRQFGMPHMYMLYPFMYLYTLNYRPLIRLDHSFWKEEEDWQAAAENAIESIGQDHDLDDGKKELIREYFRHKSQDSRYCSESEVFTGMMVWTVHR